ncbi:MAG: ATPase [Ruminococcaceae bacterium]|nr:ATPase [Oscillospiraceae bacterium]
MIVPMKKVSLIIMGNKKEETLKKLRKLGIVHIEITEGSGERLCELRDKLALLESAVFAIGKNKKAEQKDINAEKALSVAADIACLDEEKKQCQSQKIALNTELERLKSWGNVDPSSICELASKGINLSFYEMSKTEYQDLPDSVKTVRLYENKSSVKFMVLSSAFEDDEEIISRLGSYCLKLPQMSTEQMRQKISELSARIDAIDAQIASYICYAESIKGAIRSFEKEIEFETYATGMANEELSPDSNQSVSVAYFKGYIEAENLDRLKETAANNSWGLVVQEPCQEDNVPTKLKNNKFVSLIYPLTDFLGTVPGYFEYDISGWFLAFILIFFGIIFGDGGYGLLICAVAAIPVIRSLIIKKPISPTFLLVGLFGLSTILWGTLTCTWFGLSPEQLPHWLQSLSIPLISNVYADKIWYPFWTNGAAGLTTAQNLQIFCFSLALLQLTVAHIKGAVRNKGRVKMLGDIGSILQLLGIYYLVLSLVVNAEVFSFGLVIAGVPVGTVAIALIAVGFVLSFVFSNYEGSIIKSILSSLKNIVSVLLGVVNVFSDIVSYIRLWAVGLAGAAISATVNELAGPLLGNFMFMIFAIILLVFGHGLNMILNILSVIVHGIRLNTLEFSSHLDMSWSGHKFKPFIEETDYKGESL